MPLFGKSDEVKLRITGMTCGHCQRTVGDALRSVPGVKAANVDLAFHRAQVTVDPERVRVEDLLAAVHEAGYEATPAEPGTPSS